VALDLQNNGGLDKSTISEQNIQSRSFEESGTSKKPCVEIHRGFSQGGSISKINLSEIHKNSLNLLGSARADLKYMEIKQFWIF